MTADESLVANLTIEISNKVVAIGIVLNNEFEIAIIKRQNTFNKMTTIIASIPGRNHYRQERHVPQLLWQTRYMLARLLDVPTDQRNLLTQLTTCFTCFVNRTQAVPRAPIMV